MNEAQIKHAEKLHAAGFSKRSIARTLDVNESTIRRALKNVAPTVKRRVTVIVIEETV